VKFISALVVIALVLGIMSEVISIETSFYTLRKARCDASLSATEAKAKGSSIGSGESFGTRQKDYLHDCLE
jgi:hypothetical protein